MGCKIRIKVPVLPRNLRSKIEKKQPNSKQEQKQTAGVKEFWYDKHHRARNLSPQQVLPRSDNKWNVPGTVVAAHPGQRMYHVTTQSRPVRPLRRNRRHLQLVPVSIPKRMEQMHLNSE